MKRLAWMDGSICDLSEAKVPLEDRGYLFGDGVYEVIKIYNGKTFYLQPHLDRLKNSAEAIDLNVPYTKEEISQEISSLIKQSECKNGYLYMQITRGSAKRDHLLPEGTRPSMVMYVREFPSPASIEDIKPAACITLPDERWLNCYIKSVNLLPNVLARHKAAEAGAQEAIFYRPGGVVTEGTRTNIFAVIDGVVRTHPESRLILSGITRMIALEILRKLGFTVSEEAFMVDDLEKASEVWTTSTGRGIIPVEYIDSRPVAEAVPGPICRSLIEEFWKRVELECYDSGKRTN